MNVFIAENFRRGEKCSVPRSNDAEPYFPLFCLLYAYIAADFGYVWQTFVLYFLTLVFRGAINMTQLKFYNANIMRNSHENPLKPQCRCAFGEFVLCDAIYHLNLLHIMCDLQLTVLFQYGKSLCYGGTYGFSRFLRN